MMISIEEELATMCSPLGKPVALAPLSPPASEASTAPPTSPVLLLPDAIFSERRWSKLCRTVSGNSTQAPEESLHDSSEDLDEDGPPLESELGKWAREVMLAEQWLEEEWCRKQAAPQVREYVLDNSRLRAATVGVAFRRSRDLRDRVATIPGPEWGTSVFGVDAGDGWVMVGDYFLPMALAGVPVLTLADELAEGRPALTEDGRVLQLHGDLPVEGLVVCARAAAGQGAWLRATRRVAAELRAAQRVESEEVCSIDMAGVARGLHSPSAQVGEPAAQRLRRCWALRHKRAQRGEALGPACVGPDGKAFLLLRLTPPRAPSARARMLRRRRRCCEQLLRGAPPQREAGESDGQAREDFIIAMDGAGVAHF